MIVKKFNILVGGYFVGRSIHLSKSIIFGDDADIFLKATKQCRSSGSGTYAVWDTLGL